RIKRSVAFDATFSHGSSLGPLLSIRTQRGLVLGDCRGRHVRFDDAVGYVRALDVVAVTRASQVGRLGLGSQRDHNHGASDRDVSRACFVGATSSQRMHNMRTKLVTLLFIGLLVAADSPKDAAEKEAKRLEGAWVVTSAQKDGQPLDRIKGNKLVI